MASDPLRNGAIFRITNAAMLKSPMPVHVRGEHHLVCPPPASTGSPPTSLDL